MTLILWDDSAEEIGIHIARIGRRWTLVAFCLLFSIGAVSFFSTPLHSSCLTPRPPIQVLTTIAHTPNTGLNLIYAGRTISGIGIGAISAVAPAYVSECSPKNVRGRITGVFQVMVAAGVAISYFVNCEGLEGLFILFFLFPSFWLVVNVC
jgi:MFS family permease